MPRVPTYDNFQTQIAVQPNATVVAPSGPAAGAIGAEEQGQMGKALTTSGDAIAKVQNDAAEQANQLRVDNEIQALYKHRAQLQVEAISLTGRAALERPDGQSLADEYTGKLDKASQDISETLANPQQKILFGSLARKLNLQFGETLAGHTLQQQKQFQTDTWKAKAEGAQRDASLFYGDVAMRADAIDRINNVADQIIATNGWDATKDKALIDSTRQGLLDPMHTGVIEGLLQDHRVDDARAYYDQNGDTMSTNNRLKLHDAIMKSGIVVESAGAAESAWTKFAPSDINAPVKLYDMEQDIRYSLKSKPELIEPAIKNLRERVQGFNAQQTEVNSGNTNSVFGMIDKGTPMAKVQTSKEWLALPQKEQHQIILSVEQQQATRESRAASASQRQYTDLLRQDHMLLRTNAGDYLSDSNPDTLAGMTRTQVEAKRAVYGFDATQQLLHQWDTLQNKDARLTAKIDHESFNSVIHDVLDINPYSVPKGSSQEAMLGDLKARTDVLLQNAAQQARRPLTNEEKMGIMRDAAAKTVTVGGMWDTNGVNVTTLTPADAAKVKVPDADASIGWNRSKVVADMQKVYTTTGDPDYAPTPANLARMYLKKVSPLSGLPKNGQ